MSRESLILGMKEMMRMGTMLIIAVYMALEGVPNSTHVEVGARLYSQLLMT